MVFGSDGQKKMRKTCKEKEPANSHVQDQRGNDEENWIKDVVLRKNAANVELSLKAQKYSFLLLFADKENSQMT